MKPQTETVQTANDMEHQYCSQKFWWMTVNPERKTLSSCCAAAPELIDIDWLDQNSGDIFNSPNLVTERQYMLAGSRVESCRANCWSAEDAGKVSRRLHMNSHVFTHECTRSSPEVLNIIMGTDCNLTCVYCCKQFSTAWLRDINMHGSYMDEDRFRINASDKILLNLGQKNLGSSAVYKKIIDSALSYSTVRSVEISGGEPFLYNGLLDILDRMSVPTVIFTGLGVNHKRFASIVDRIGPNVTVVISAETVGSLYEFTRYGNSYDNFLRNIEILVQKGLAYKFAATLSNLTMLGYHEFEQEFGSEHNLLQFCNDPDYLSMSVMDPDSKTLLSSKVYKYQDHKIKSALQVEYSQKQKQDLSIFIHEFVRRRNLQIDVLPESFRDWLQNGN